VARNKVLTRENLAKRRALDDVTCLFCSEAELAGHLFFSCCVETCVWERAADVLNIGMVNDFESLARWWIRGEKYNAINVFHVGVLWTLWKKKNRQELGAGEQEEDVAKLDTWAGRPGKICWSTAKVNGCDASVIELW
jgi:hypothetical protein